MCACAHPFSVYVLSVPMSAGCISSGRSIIGRHGFVHAGVKKNWRNINMARRQLAAYLQYLVEQEEKIQLREIARMHLTGSPRRAAQQLISELKARGILDAQGNVIPHD